MLEDVFGHSAVVGQQCEGVLIVLFDPVDAFACSLSCVVLVIQCNGIAAGTAGHCVDAGMQLNRLTTGGFKAEHSSVFGDAVCYNIG